MLVTEHTDPSTSQLLTASGRLKGKDAKIFVISAGNITDHSQLKQVVTNDKYLHTIKVIDEILSVVSDLSSRICNDSQGWENNTQSLSVSFFPFFARN